MLKNILITAFVFILASGFVFAQDVVVTKGTVTVIQEITNSITRSSYPTFTVKKGVPVRWTLLVSMKDLNGCNSTIVIPEYKIEKKLGIGKNIIEFIPEKEGNIKYSCWMGMIKANIKVE